MDIQLCLIELGITENVSPDLSSYSAMVATWRGSMPAPTEAALEAVWPTVQANMQDQQIAHDLAETDRDMATVIEDALSVLESRNIMREADLSQESRDKLARRRAIKGL